MTPEQEWHVLAVSNAPVNNIAQARYKGQVLLDLVDEIEKVFQEEPDPPGKEWPVTE